MRKILILTALAAIIAGCSKEDGSWNDPVIPETLKGIEAVNIDNSGENPLITNSPIKKEAYMVGIKWITDNAPTEEDNIFITGPIRRGQQKYSSIANSYSKAIRCNTQFNSNIPPGTYVSKYFKEINRNYLPADVNEGFVLLVAPTPGEHSFRVEYHQNNELKFYYDTPLINFF